MRERYRIGLPHAGPWRELLNTDAALYLGITWQWFKDGTYDKDYLKTHAVGVEAYEAYVMGEEDGVAKTPDWAAPLCGVPARTIRALAREWASKRTSIVIGNGEITLNLCYLPTFEEMANGQRIL